MVEMAVILPLLLLLLGGAVDFSRSLADRAAIVEVARTSARAACRTWVVNETAIKAQATRAVERYLGAAGYDPVDFQTDVRILDLDLSGTRYTKGVEVKVTALAPLRPLHFLPGSLSATISGAGFYRLENAHVWIKETEG